jgi:predicted anti-sigma-YlaC factor YlaD
LSAENCQRQDELLDALGRGYVGPELDAHTLSCDACGELRLVAGALLDDKSHAMSEATVPSAGTMWWRMRMRHRREAEATARRSLAIGQAVTLMIAVALAATFFGAEVKVAVQHLVGMARQNSVLLYAILTSILVAPIAGWVAIRQK